MEWLCPNSLSNTILYSVPLNATVQPLNHAWFVIANLALSVQLYTVKTVCTYVTGMQQNRTVGCSRLLPIDLCLDLYDRLFFGYLDFIHGSKVLVWDSFTFPTFYTLTSGMSIMLTHKILSFTCWLVNFLFSPCFRILKILCCESYFVWHIFFFKNIAY